uniref:Reverse transcriptase zinc-binding domain-containing protein n=1 Tax=Aegilops tauschii subsp. strangulata TaxID=200361 RepID=A0A453JJ04_AEGTS
MILKTKIQREEWLDEHQGFISNKQQDNDGWPALWNLRVPSKLKVFAWGLARQSIPTGDLLHHRNLATTLFLRFVV